MAKKSLKKATKQLAPETVVARAGRVYPAEPVEPKGQQRRVKKAALRAEPPESAAVHAAPAVRPAAPTIAEALPPATPPKVRVTFVLLEPDAHRVSLSGEFNGWSLDATPLKRQEGGHWETTVALAPGRYQYKFVVDGQWIPDPLARENVWNQHGTLNSVITV